MTHDPQAKPILCPSSHPENDGAQIFGAMTEVPGHGLRLGYLTEAVPVTPDILAASGKARPTEVLRVAAPCAAHACTHFDGSACRLATRVATMLDPVVRALPRCAIRPTCRWFRQEGAAACVRCPQVVTHRREATELQQAVSGLPPMLEPSAAEMGVTE